MKFPKSCKIELVATKDSSYVALLHPYLIGSQLTATDGRRLVVIPVEREEGDTDGRISAAALAASRKLANRATGEACIKANSVQSLTDGSTLPRPTKEECGQFPNWEQVIPHEEHPHFITLNAKFLWECVQAIGAEHITLSIKDEVSPCIITSPDLPGAKAVLMPIRTT